MRLLHKNENLPLKSIILQVNQRHETRSDENKTDPFDLRRKAWKGKCDEE